MNHRNIAIHSAHDSLSDRMDYYVRSITAEVLRELGPRAVGAEIKLRRQEPSDASSKVLCDLRVQIADGGEWVFDGASPYAHKAVEGALHQLFLVRHAPRAPIASVRPTAAQRRAA